MSDYRAVRRVKGKSHIVEVLGPEGSLGTLGGNRASRAQAAIVTHWPKEASPGIWGLRGDLSAARSEAARMLTQTHKVTKNRFTGQKIEVPLNRPHTAFAVPVEEADERIESQFHDRRED